MISLYLDRSIVVNSSSDVSQISIEHFFTDLFESIWQFEFLDFFLAGVFRSAEVNVIVMIMEVSVNAPVISSILYYVRQSFVH